MSNTPFQKQTGPASLGDNVEALAKFGQTTQEAAAKGSTDALFVQQAVKIPGVTRLDGQKDLNSETPNQTPHATL